MLDIEESHTRIRGGNPIGWDSIGKPKGLVTYVGLESGLMLEILAVHGGATIWDVELRRGYFQCCVPGNHVEA